MLNLLPYGLVFATILSTRHLKNRMFFWGLFTLTVLTSLYQAVISPIAFLGLTILGILAHIYSLWGKPKFPFLKLLFSLLLMIVALGFFMHLVPGFQNYKYWDMIQISPHAKPYTMYFNLDKSLAGALILYAIGGLNFTPLNKAHGLIIIKALIPAIALLMGAGIGGGYIGVDPKLSNLFWIWALQNLVFVCIMEEALFRGLFLNDLKKFTDAWGLSYFVPLVASALLFGGIHILISPGSALFGILAAIAGIFYGWAYLKTQRLEVAILVHFLVNVLHFIGFTYPSML